MAKNQDTKPPSPPSSEQEESVAFRRKLEAIVARNLKEKPFDEKSPKEQAEIRKGLYAALDKMGDALEASGVTEEELDAEIREARKQVYAEELAKKSGKKDREK